MKSWHALFAPLPPDAVPRRTPVLPPELAQTEHAAAIAGWDSLVVDLSDPPNGGRVVDVVLDGADRPISASDHVLVRFPHEAPAGMPVRMRQEASVDGSRSTAASAAPTGMCRASSPRMTKSRTGS
jgi:hypothetical protein